jgi:quinol monooxygenase YgiN
MTRRFSITNPCRSQVAITALCELRPHPDQTVAVVQRLIEQLSLPSRSVAGRHCARLFQHGDDPAWLLYLTEWTSREAYDAYRQAAPMPGLPDQFQQLPSTRFYRRLALFERVLTPVARVSVNVVGGPAASHPIRRDQALTYHRSNAHAQPDLVLLQVHDALDAEPALLIVTGWGTAHPNLADARTIEQALLERLIANGGTVRQFVGHAVVETPGT